MMKKLKAIVVGGGIHGLTSAIAMSKNGLDVRVIDKNKGLMGGTSGSTQNRAHRGYHYPRSVDTAIECLRGLKIFEDKYPDALVYPREGSFYMVEKEDSKTSPQEFASFCDEVNIPYELKFPSEDVVYRDSISESFKVPEGVFDLETLSENLIEEAKRENINLELATKLEEINCRNSGYDVIVVNGNGKKRMGADVVLNATYAYANNIIKGINADCELTKYDMQRTEVAVAKSRRDLPALTIMDGKFVSVLPYGREESKVLVYDVLHSVIDREEGYFLDDSKKYPTNFNRMVEHGEKYYPFMRDLEYVSSLYGSRPIPLDVVGDSRRTRIKSYSSAPGFYSILEGKFISAPLIADELVVKMKDDGVL